MQKIFTCKLCLKEFKYNYLLVRHQNAKKSCDNSDKIINKMNLFIKNTDNTLINLYNTSLKSKINCYFCNTTYVNKSNLKRHLDNYCEKRLAIVEEKQKHITKLQTYEHNQLNKITTQNEELQQKIKDLEKILEINKNNKINNTTIIENSNNTTNIDKSNNINIFLNQNKTENEQINSFGNEDLSHITNKDYERYLSKYFLGLLEYIEKVHFSKEQPSNYNICIPKINSKHVAIFEKEQWNLKDKNELIDRLISKKIIALSKKCDELEENGLISEKIVDMHNEFNYNYHIGDEETKKTIETDIALLLFNNRNKIKNYDKLLK
jgi:hypothetical protein